MKPGRLQGGLLSIALTALVACGGKQPGIDDPAPAAEAGTAQAPEDREPAAASPSPGPAAATDVPLAVSDIDAYVRGMRRQIALLQATVDKAAEARRRGDGEAESMAVLEVSMADRDTPAAAAAGLPVERWRLVETRIASIIGAAATRQQMMAAGGDAADLPPGQRAEFERNREAMLASLPDPYRDLDPAVAAALKARHEELAKLHGESTALMFQAGG